MLRGIFKGQTPCQGKFFETDHYKGYDSYCLLAQLSTCPHITQRRCPLYKGHIHPNYFLLKCNYDTETNTMHVIIL